MKYLFILFILGTFVGNANAAMTKCVKFNSSSTCTRTSTPSDHQTEFSLTCNGVTIKGVGLTAAGKPSSWSTPVDKVYTATATSSGFTYCYCKILSPAVSQWMPIYRSNGLSYGYSCPNICVDALTVKDSSYSTDTREAFLGATFSN